MTSSPDRGGAFGLALVAAACVAVALPTAIAYNVPPSATFFNQVAALVGWGFFLLLPSLVLVPSAWRPPADAWPLIGALAATAMLALLSSVWAALPWSLSLQAAGLIAAAILTVIVGAACARAGLGVRVFDALCWALVVAGVIGSVVGIVQVYAPSLADGDWIAHAALPGRASGNLRQPNHLSSVLVWSLVAVVWLAETARLQRTLAAALGTVILFVVVLTGSRTGAIDVVGIAVWGVVDRRLSRHGRIALVLVPMAYAAFWVGVTEWAHLTHHVFGGEARFEGKGDISASRFGIWSNTLSLIAAHPWLGVGFGEFNFAWTLTPFPGRPVAFFDHTHNVVLQLAVEFGLPIAILLLAALGVALWRAFCNAREAGDAAPGASGGVPLERAAFVMVLMAAVHSQLEYPLWYAYFLLPTAFAWGLCLRGPTPAASSPPAGENASRDRPTRPLLLASMMLVLGGTVALYDYARVVVIFAPPADAGPLEDRIEAGRHSWFFTPHADYAAATTADHPSTAMPSFKVATHYLLDARLMMAWARALEETGDDARARYVAQRLREFRNPTAAAFFEPCDDAALPEARKPFQCKPPPRDFSYLDFR